MSDIVVDDIVKRVSSDYTFVGVVRAVFPKLSGLTRYVVEDDRGVLFIWNRKNMELLDENNPELVEFCQKIVRKRQSER